MKIAKLTTKQVQTKYGLKDKWLITDETGKLYDVWVGNWCRGWKEGDDVQVKPEQIKSREWEGKTYWTIQAPPEARMGGVNLEPVLEALRKVWAKLEEMEKKLDEIHQMPRQ